ncbi:hypothetical protein I5M32_03645 [Pedobacter sp. SD-b]|uniref:SMI1/KNR4 family protein n=1 Tax=Pedobacter segetis TaxID=2793069 RepID=A0ABS1BGQ2_9SPHI|nr:hypothetical protein [Pedobacter segetis]MBK0382043.1 hypothetical protein [Pedobacter segetis]
MLETIMATSMLMSLSTDYRKNSYLANIISNKSDTIEEVHLEPLNNYFADFISIGNFNKVEKKFFQLLNLNEISSEVYNNSYSLLTEFPEFILEEIDVENIYTSKYGTLLLDFEYDNKNIFSLEIGKDSIGYFSEINSKTDVFCESLKTIDNQGNTINAKQISSEIENFLSKLNLV